MLTTWAMVDLCGHRAFNSTAIAEPKYIYLGPRIGLLMFVTFDVNHRGNLAV
jgi:hypothetical protein